MWRKSFRTNVNNWDGKVRAQVWCNEKKIIISTYSLFYQKNFLHYRHHKGDLKITEAGELDGVHFASPDQENWAHHASIRSSIRHRCIKFRQLLMVAILGHPHHLVTMTIIHRFANKKTQLTPRSYCPYPSSVLSIWACVTNTSN